MRDHYKDELRKKSLIKKKVPAATVVSGISEMFPLLKQQSAPDIDIYISSVEIQWNLLFDGCVQ